MSGAPSARSPRDADSLWDHAACGLLVTAANGMILRVNRTFCDWVGRTPEQLVGAMTMQSLLTMGGRIFHQTHWAPLLQLQGSVSEVKLEVVHPDGRILPVIWNAVRHVVDGEPMHELAVFMATDRDRYERELILARTRAETALCKEQAAQQALLAAQEERDRLRVVAEDRALFAEQMVAVVSHDLRNPLSVIHLSAQLIGRGELSERQLRSLKQLDSSAARATRLISDLLDFSQARIGSGLQVERAELALHAVVAESVDELKLAFPGRDLQHVPVGMGRCAASADRLMQMIGNLVANALAYGAADRPVIVTSTIDDRNFSIAVHNEGSPIPAGLIPTLFDPMTRGGGESTTHSIGLGLYIVREIARAHGGDVSVSSAADIGTTFTAVFPCNI